MFAPVFSSGLRAAPGDLEATFDPNTNTDGYVYDTTLQPDGKIIVGGYFTTLQPNGAASSYGPSAAAFYRLQSQ